MCVTGPSAAPSAGDLAVFGVLQVEGPGARWEPSREPEEVLEMQVRLAEIVRVAAFGELRGSVDVLLGMQHGSTAQVRQGGVGAIAAAFTRPVAKVLSRRRSDRPSSA